MPRGPRNQHTGSTVEHSKAHADGVQCAFCKSTKSEFRFFNCKDKTKTQRLPGYKCLNSECNIKFWVERGPTLAPNNTRSGAMSNPVVADAAPQLPPPTAAAASGSQREPKMPRPRNEHTGRTVENRKANPDGIECPTCKSTKTKFRFFNNKKESQPRYQCLDSKCKKFWTVGGTTRAPYNRRTRPVSNPVVADAAPQPPPIIAAVRRGRSQRSRKPIQGIWGSASNIFEE